MLAHLTLNPQKEDKKWKDLITTRNKEQSNATFRLYFSNQRLTIIHLAQFGPISFQLVHTVSLQAKKRNKITIFLIHNKAFSSFTQTQFSNPSLSRSEK